MHSRAGLEGIAVDFDGTSSDANPCGEPESQPLLVNAGGDPRRTKTLPPERTLGLMGLVLLVFFNTVGSPCGIEPAVGAGGPLLAIMAVIGVAVLWSMPLGLMAAELSLMCEADGNAGTFNWVYRAFGPLTASINGTNSILQYLVSNALTLLLIPLYLPRVDTDTTARLVAALVVPTVGGVLLNAIPPESQSRATVMMTPVIYIPFAVLFVYAWADGMVAPAAVLREVPPRGAIPWSVFLSTAIWCAGGVDRIGNAAGEIKGGRGTYLLGLTLALALGVANYVIPLILCYLIAPHRAVWTTGYFGRVGYRVSPGMGVMMVVTTAFACVAQYTAAVFPLARLLWAAAVVPDPDRRLLPRVVATSYRLVGGRVVIPIGGIVCASLACFALAFLSYDLLVEVYLVLRICNLALQWAALVALRWTEPDAPRPYAIPGGWLGIALVLLPFVAVTAVLFATANALSLAIGFGLQPVIVVGFLARRFFRSGRGW